MLLAGFKLSMKGGSQSPYCPHCVSEQCLWEPSDGSWKQSMFGKRHWTENHVPQLFGKPQSNSTPRESSFLERAQQTKVNFNSVNTWLTHTSTYRCLQMFWWFVPKVHSSTQMKMLWRERIVLISVHAEWRELWWSCSKQAAVRLKGEHNRYHLL